jgi:hypothetical protein
MDEMMRTNLESQDFNETKVMDDQVDRVISNTETSSLLLSQMEKKFRGHMIRQNVLEQVIEQTLKSFSGRLDGNGSRNNSS